MSDVAELRALLAEAEQARWEQHEEITALLVRLRVTDALLCEYEEALRQIVKALPPGDDSYDGTANPVIGEIARDALDASGDREAPDTKEPK